MTSIIKLLIITLLISSCSNVNRESYYIGKNPLPRKPITSGNTAQETFIFGSKKVKVGILVPLTGKHKALGNSLLNSAILSLFDNDKGEDIDLYIFDTKGTVYGAEQAIASAVTENIQLVIGPIFSSSVQAIAKTIKSNNMVSLSFSNNQNLMGNQGVFLMGFLPEQQIEKIVDYSISKGRSNFALIAPSNQYGLKISKILKETIDRKDSYYISGELYLKNKDITKAAERVINSYIVSERTYENQEEGQKKSDITVKDEDKIYPDVILVPESGKNLSQIVLAINEANKQLERDLQIIGTNQWDDISTLNDKNLSGAWFPATDPNNYKKFEKKYYQIYGKFPIRISSIAYDSVKVILDLIDDTGKTTFTTKDFTEYTGKRNGFEGIDGIFRFLPNGIVERRFGILEVGNQEFHLIEEPLKVFLKSY